MAVTLLQSIKAATPAQGNNVGLSVSQTWGSTTTAGSLLIAVATGSGYFTAATMTTAGMTWAAVGFNGFSAFGAFNSVYYCINAPSISNATNNTFATTVGAGYLAEFTLYEFGGFGLGSFDTSVSADANFGTALQPNPGAITVAGAGELIIGTTFIQNYLGTYTNPAVNGSFAAGQLYTPFVVTNLGQYASQVDEYLLSSSSGSNATTYSGLANDSGHLWAATAAAFIPVASAAAVGGGRMPVFFTGSKSG